MATGDTFTPVSTTIQGDYFVATNGSDSNPGTISQPFRTIAKGVSMLTPGKTLLVRSGTYAESLQNTIPGGTSWSSPVTVAAYPGDTVTIQPSSGASRALFFARASKQYIIVQGFIIDARNVTLNAVKITNSSSGGVASHIRITDCEIENAPSQGILTTDGANYNEFIRLNVHNNGTRDLDHGIYISTSSNLIDSCNVYNNAGSGVQIYSEGSTTDCTNNIVRNCKLHDNAGVDNRGWGVTISCGSGNQVYNNLVWGNRGGIDVEYGSVSNTSVYNNTIYNNTKNGGEYNLHVGSDSTGAIIRNNIVYTGSGFLDEGVGSTKDHNLVGINPLFVNAAANDFHLQSGSPTINAGTSIGAPTTDFDGNTRPQGSGYDIGPHEYVSP